MDESVKRLQELIEVLRECGVSKYSNEGLYIELFPVERQVQTIGIQPSHAEREAEPMSHGYLHPSLNLVKYPESKTDVGELGFGVPLPRK